jgi:signal transduction histidine kinase
MTNITHELRTPIHGVMGLTEVIESGVYGEVTDKQREALVGIRKSADGLLRMVDDLLQLAKAESGKIRVNRSRFSVEELLERSVSAARWMQGRKNLTIELDVAADMPEIESDPVMVGHVVVNLLSNAIKFTPEDGRIFVRARMRDSHTAEIAVQDTGVGIPAKELPHIFDEFRQVDGTSSRRYGGAGLGLSLVKTVTESLGGEVTVASRPDRGSTFTVCLPV